jgi:hypothetical protein
MREVGHGPALLSMERAATMGREPPSEPSTKRKSFTTRRLSLPRPILAAAGRFSRSALLRLLTTSPERCRPRLCPKVMEDSFFDPRNPRQDHCNSNISSSMSSIEASGANQTDGSGRLLRRPRAGGGPGPQSPEFAAPGYPLPRARRYKVWVPSVGADPLG